MAAAPALLEYIALIHDSAEKTGVYLNCGMDDTSSYLRLSELTRAWELFAKAARAVQDDPVLSRRVRRARMPLDHEWIKRYAGLKRGAALKGIAFTGPEDPAALVADFLKSASEFDAGQTLRGPTVRSLRRGSRKTGSPRPPRPARPRSVKVWPPVEWMDIQEREFILYNRIPGTWVTLG